MKIYTIKWQESKFLIDIVTIQPVISKSMPSKSSAHDSVHSTTITALPSTIMATQAPGIVIVPHRPSLPVSSHLIAGSSVFQKQSKVTNMFSPKSLQNVSPTVLIGGHVFKQDGT